MGTSLSSLVTALLLLSGSVYGGKILVIHPVLAPSHILAQRTLAAHMAARGHTLTVVAMKSSIPDVTIANTTQITLNVDNTDGNIPFMTKGQNASVYLPTDTWEQGHSFSFVQLKGVLLVAAFCRSLLGNTALIDRLKGEQFDVVIADLMYNECSLALAHHLEVPVVGYWGFSFSSYEPMYTAAVNPPSVVPYVFSHISGDMDFRNRVWNYFLHLYAVVIMQVHFFMMQYQVDQYLPGPTPHPSILLANLSGVLLGSHPVLDYPRQLPPTYIEVGGFHMNPTKPLPKQLDEFLSSAGPQGAVLFSLGCTFNTDYMPPAVVKGYLAAFARLPNKVLMRATGQLPPLPPNVMVMDWLPQADVLAHPNTVLFVTHCGLHGVMEAIHHAVPMVGLPIFLDQKDVMLRLQEKGVIVGVDKDGGEDQLFHAMMEVLNNSTYARQVSYLSQVMKHYNPNPKDTAAWLLEHVMLTKGAPYLKIRTRGLSTVQYMCLDVMAFYGCSVAALMYIGYRLIVSKVERHVPSKIKSH